MESLSGGLTGDGGRGFLIETRDDEAGKFLSNGGGKVHSICVVIFAQSSTHNSTIVVELTIVRQTQPVFEVLVQHTK